LHHPDVQFSVPKAPLKVVGVKNVSVSLLLVNEAPVSSEDPAAGSSAGEVRLMNPEPMMSAMVRLSALFLAPAL